MNVKVPEQYYMRGECGQVREYSRDVIDEVAGRFWGQYTVVMMVGEGPDSLHARLSVSRNWSHEVERGNKVQRSGVTDL